MQMAMLRKRRASDEVQELMNAVKSDYEFFSRLDSPFQSSPQPKRQRYLSDNVLVQYAVVRPKPRYNEGLNLSKSPCGKYLDKTARLDEYSSLPASRSTRTPLQHRRRGGLQSREVPREEDVSSREEGVSSREACVQLREKEQMFHQTTPDFWACHAERTEVSTRKDSSSFDSRSTRIASQPIPKTQEPWPQMRNPSEFICLSSQPIILRNYGQVNADDMVAWKQKVDRIPSSHNARELETSVEERTPYDVPPLLIRVDTNVSRGPPEDEPRNRSPTRSTQMNLHEFPMSEAGVHETPRITRQISRKAEKSVDRRGNYLKKKAEEIPDSDSEDELIIVESPDPISRQSPDNASPTNGNAQDNQVTSTQTNEKPEVGSKEVIPSENNSTDGSTPVTLSPTSEIWPHYVVTRVGSLLWLDKDIVYPITLDEMRRRIQDPENFSFQMLIAYVRHSRAKGRQFLDYWKCQPSGRTCRPNVLSKLCEADARELVGGIHKVNEEYFPGETLARTTAASIFQEKGNRMVEDEEKDGPKVEEKVNAIEKSRSVFKILQKILENSEDDERFDTFNVASHNAGLENIKNSLKFLESIFERMQNHVKGNHKSLPALTY